MQTSKKILAALNLLLLISAFGCGGQSSTSTVPASLLPAPAVSADPPPTVSLSATPATLVGGGAVALAWTSTNASSVSIDQGIGAVAPSGSKSITVQSTTTWTATAKDAKGNTVAATATVTVLPPPLPPPPPQVGHVVVVVFENKSYETVFGNPAAPLINSLALQGGLATSFYSNVHVSLKSYFMLTTGQIASNGITYLNPPFTDDNIVRELIAGNKTWKGYFQGLPQAGYTGPDVGAYTVAHNPLAFFSDVLNNPVQANNFVPLEQLAADLASGNLPNFSFVIADQNNIMHDCPLAIPNCDTSDVLAAGDDWLKTYIGPVLADPVFQKDGVLIVTWDEGADTDLANGGGHVMTFMAGPLVKPGFQSSNFYQFESLLRFMCENLHLPGLPGAAQTAPRMDEFLMNPLVH